MSSPISAEVLVIGAGPAGIAAATAAAEHGRSVIVLDDNRQPGGQIWREVSIAQHRPIQQDGHRKLRALDRLHRSGAQLLTGRSVFSASPHGRIETFHEDSHGGKVEQFDFEQLVLATGARERFLPFPGWTLQGVFGVGGLQALARAGYPIAGKRVIVAGSGPLLLAVAAHLVAAGAIVTAVAEQAPLSRLATFTASLCLHPAKLVQGVRYRAALRSCSYRTGRWVVEALAAPQSHNLSAVRITDGSRTWIEPCDLLASGYHLVPNTEIAELLGCALRDTFVQVDHEQRTSLQNVFCVGEPTAIGGLDAAIAQGTVAGLASAGISSNAAQRKVIRERAFAHRINKAFTLRDDLRSLPKQDTIVCRCEDVPFAELKSHSRWSDIKLQSRCGMGPCQARICGPAVEFILNCKPASVRQPLYPVPLHALCSPGGSTLQTGGVQSKIVDNTEEKI